MGKYRELHGKMSRNVPKKRGKQAKCEKILRNMGNCGNSPEMHGKPMLSAIKTQNDLKMGNNMRRYVSIA